MLRLASGRRRRGCWLLLRIGSLRRISGVVISMRYARWGSDAVRRTCEAEACLYASAKALPNTLAPVKTTCDIIRCAWSYVSLSSTRSKRSRPEALQGYQPYCKMNCDR